jgi:hypothetical protein
MNGTLCGELPSCRGLDREFSRAIAGWSMNPMPAFTNFFLARQLVCN